MVDVRYLRAHNTIYSVRVLTIMQYKIEIDIKVWFIKIVH